MNGNLDSSAPASTKLLPDISINHNVIPTRYDNGHSTKPLGQSQHEPRNNLPRNHDPSGPSNHHNRRDHRMPFNSSHPPFESHLHSQHPQPHPNHQNFNNHIEKKNRNFKLLADPHLKKCQAKKIRYDGQGDICELKDPRSRPTWIIREVIDLIVPRFKIDKNYIGIPPAIEVSIENLNDNIDKSFLEDKLRKYGAIEEIEIFYHPDTRKHLGLAKVLFYNEMGARNCVERMHGSSVMGNIINVFFDPFGKKINEIYENIVNPPAASDPQMTNDNFIDPNNSEIASTLPPLSASTDFGYMTDSSAFGSSFQTPSINYDSQFYPSNNQYYNEDGSLTNHNTDPNASPLRESLQSRISLLKSHTQFLDFHNNIDINDVIGDAGYYRKNSQKKIDESEAILGTPPSPFVSASEYVKWHKYTKDVDSGTDPTEAQVGEEEKREVEEDDDDCMSLSSLSSGEKLDGSSMPTTMFVSEPAQLANWKPLMPVAFNSLQIPYMYQSFLQQSNSSSLGPGQIWQVDPFSIEDKEKNKRELLDELTQIALSECFKDLKLILSKDMYKKITENFSYKLLDKWWDDNQKEHNSKSNQINESNDIRPVNRGENIIHHFFNYLAPIRPDQNMHSTYGLSRGFRAAENLSILPSFKKKKIKSPPRLIDDKLSDISTDEDEFYQKRRKPRTLARRYKRKRSSSSESSKSSSSSASSRSTSSKSSSRYSSASFSSGSKSSSSSSDSDSNSDSDSSYSSSDNDSRKVRKPSIKSSSEAGSSSESSSEWEKESDESGSDKSASSKLVENVKASPHLSASPMSVTAVEASPKRPIPTEHKEIVNDTVSTGFDSDTDTADEAVEEMKKDDMARAARGSTLEQSTAEKEFEASQALIALANNLFGSSSVTNVDKEEFYQNNPIAREHNYAIPHLEVPPKPEPSNKTNTKKVNQKAEKKKSSKKVIKVTDENIAPEIGAVASEWRDAKRKTVTAKSKIGIDNKKPKIEVPEVKIAYPPRDAEAELAILYNFEINGLDAEDILYLKRSYQQMLQEENPPPWINEIHWVDHPPTVMHHPRKKRKSDYQHIHKTGCARTEGYYKLDKSEKMKYSHVANETPETNPVGNANIRTRQVEKTNQQQSRENRSNQRRLCSAIEDFGSYNLLKFNQLTLRKKKLTFAKSRIHEWGLFALETIAADEFVIEYVGQRIRSIVADTREKRYERKGIDTSYLFRIDTETIVDATKCGNVARFINHSCSPNCYAKVITVEGEKKIVIYSKQLINIGEEITYDYKFPIEDSKIPCLCGGSQCRGYLN